MEFRIDQRSTQAKSIQEKQDVSFLSTSGIDEICYVL